MNDPIKKYIKKQNEVLSKPMKTKEDIKRFNEVMSINYMKTNYNQISKNK